MIVRFSMASFLGRCAISFVPMLNLLVAGLMYDPYDESRRTNGLENEPGCWDHKGPKPDGMSELRRRTTVAFELEQSLSKERLGTNATLQYIVTNLRRRCVGAAWNGARCHILTQGLRKFTWHRLRKLMRDAGYKPPEKPPVVKIFRRGGGLAVDVPCAGGGHGKFYYRHVHMAEGSAIKESLAANAQSGQYAVDDDWEQNSRCEELGHERARYIMKQDSNYQKPVLFTFVRNPVEKFIAGYKDMASQHLLDTMHEGSKVGSPRHVTKFLQDVMFGTCDIGHVLLQVQNLFGHDCESHFDFVGKLDSLEEDWTRVGVEGGCEKGLTWTEQPRQTSDLDDQGAEKAMRKILAKDDNRFMKVLCWWTLPDFIVFGYELPDRKSVV